MKYEVTLLIDQGKLSLLTALLDKSDGIEIGKIERKEDPVAVKKSKYADGHRFKGISGVGLIRHELANTPKMYRKALERAFSKRGFAPKSGTSAISKAKREGVIEVDSYGRYSLVAKKAK